MRYTEKLSWILDENPATRRGYNEEKVRENLWKLMGGTPREPARAAERPVVVNADDFDDED